MKWGRLGQPTELKCFSQIARRIYKLRTSLPEKYWMVFSFVFPSVVVASLWRYRLTSSITFLIFLAFSFCGVTGFVNIYHWPKWFVSRSNCFYDFLLHHKELEARLTLTISASLSFSSLDPPIFFQRGVWALGWPSSNTVVMWDLLYLWQVLK